jgi:hypothetical protein
MTEQSIQNTQQDQATTEGNQKKTRQTRTKSLYLFPVYDFNMARMIAETVERTGAGTLSEATLAITLSQSAKSSGFLLKTLTARQFGLLIKQGDTLSTTPLAKSIFKSTTEDEKKKALIESFLKIPLFRAVADRFKGQAIPQSEAFRNVLEREFKVDSKRVGDAEKVLIDSARDTGVLIKQGSITYLSAEMTISQQQQEGNTFIPEVPPSNSISIGVPSIKPSITGKPSSGSNILQKGMLPSIAEEDLLGLSDDEFNNFWGAFGKIVRNRAKKITSEGEVKESDKK